MSLAHNGIIRGLNSIYLQATKLPHNNITTARDFLTYCQCWSESMHHHHDAEEKEFFPSLEAISGIEGLMTQNIEQHRAFTPGFEQFEAYCRTCPPAEFDGQKLQGLVEGFAEPLTKHLYDEIDTLRALDKYDSGRIRQAYRRFEKSLMATDNVSLVWKSLGLGVTDRVTATDRTSGLWDCGSKFRRWHSRFSCCAVLCPLCDPLCVRQTPPWGVALQSLYALERSQGAGVSIVRFRSLRCNNLMTWTETTRRT